MRHAWLLACVCGCQLVYGVSAPTADGPGSGSGSGSVMVTGSFARARIANAPDGTTLVTREVYPASRLTLSVVLDDGTAPGVTYDPTNGTFSFVRERDEQAYRLTRTLDGSGAEYQTAVSELAITEPVVGRADAAAATHETDVAFELGGLTALQPVEITTTGTFGISVLQPEPQTFTYDWQGMVAVVPGAPAGLPDATKGDRVFVLDVAMVGSGSAGPAYEAIGAAAELSTTLIDGGSAAVSGTFSAAPQTCATITTQHVDDVARFLRDVPGSDYVGYIGAWQIDAIPGESTGIDAALGIAEGFDPAGPGSQSNTTNTVTTVAPYGAPLFVELGASLSRAVTVGGLAAKIGGVSSQYYMPIAYGQACGAATVPAPPMTGLAHTIALAGTELTGTDVTLAIDPSADSTLTWEVDGPADVFEISVFELAASAGGLVVTPTTVIWTTTPSAVIAAGTLVANHQYVFVVSPRVGEPGAGSGTFGPITYPFGMTQTVTHVVTVTP